MKNFLKISGLLVVTLLFFGCQKSDNFYQYPFNTAKITYQISGTSTGSSEVLIKNDHKVIKDQIVVKKVDGTEEKINRITISKPDKVYILNVDTKTGSSYPNQHYNELKELSPDKRQDKLLSQIVQGQEASGDLPKPESSEEVAGQKCAVYKNQYTKTCLWFSIPLKTVIDMSTFGVNTQTVATKIELNQTIDDSVFNVPTDYKIQELNLSSTTLQ